MKIVASLFTDRTLQGTIVLGQRSYAVCGYSHTAPSVPVGTYRFVLAIAVPSENPLRGEFGPKVLLFKSIETGKLVALHAGHALEWGVFLATDGSLRVGYDEICKLASKAKKSTSPVTLTVTERTADSTTKLLGTRTSETRIPPCSLRESVSTLAPKVDHWQAFAKYYEKLGCTLCQMR